MNAGNCSLILLCSLVSCSTGDAPENRAENGAQNDSISASSSADSSVAGDTQSAEWTAGVTSSTKRAPGNALLRALRTAAHPEFERITFEFADEQMPAWHIEYVDKPVRSCASGDVVPVAGDAWLEIRFSGADAHDQNGSPTVTMNNPPAGLTLVREMTETCDFEADVTWVVGVSTPARYRTLVLKAPARLVVDLAAR